MNRFIPTHSSKFRPFRRHASSPTTAPGTVTATGTLHPLHILWRYQILDPDSHIVSYWNHVFLVTCLIALFIDPLYFFLPYAGGPACLATDTHLGVLITFFRTVADLFYVLHIVIKFRTAFVAPSSRVFGRGELVMDSREISKRYLKSDFVVDLAAALPLPQIVIWLVIPATKNSRSDHANNTLALMVLIQYIPRLIVVFPLNSQIIKSTGLIARTAWAGAAYNLILYMLASHVLGATWYLLSIGRQFSCWKKECSRENASHLFTCIPSFLDCNSLAVPERQYWLNVTRVVSRCDPKNDDIVFRFGMFADAFINDVASSRFIAKYLYCLWWGLRNLSSYGQTLQTTIYLGETLFAILTCIAGLILFSQLIGNMQTYLQSMTVRLEEWRIKRRDTEEWMRHRQLPLDLQERVRRFVQYKWLATRGVNEESILRSLPMDLRREIQRHLSLGLVRRVPFFSQMDDQLLDAICERLVSSLSTQGTYIVQEGDLVNEMLFIIRGQLESSTTNGGRAGFFSSIILRPGDFCGEELLTWALVPNSSLSLPSSTQTVRALTEVEAFALRAEDLKFVAHQFKRLQSKKLQHAFRNYSHQWRTWGACFIQSAWRRFKKKKLAKELARHESSGYLSIPDEDIYYNTEVGSGFYEDEGGEGSSADVNNAQHLGATILASKFAANTRRGAHQKPPVVDTASTSLKMPKLFKPEEPDFSLD
ncbi:putative cyclic nucleotide-gated ion channel 18 [Tripterygium wilfordii]|uniref:Putative cyclic nucleotide-gated ion channel 18 n=1 Tax=Tripterygium wilfordii TaxID=458696 RepID=A0A7J7D2R1_TRIWF|nr:cyclic nucleotide-gated ion channel 18 [Tripterygium wilfordii]KAF5740356.1 putative cyclic nucleotide-gated ion channel 18 [Tripterygium wilfordii]